MNAPSATSGPTADPEESIRHLSEPARAAFRTFRATGSVDALDPLILGILESFLPRKTARSLADIPGDTRLMDDLGLDSLAITEIVFFTEDIFGIRIENTELLHVRTLDDLRTFIRQKVTARSAS